MADRRYVLCRPIGGLNDSLCQIELCRRYAETWGRILIVDGRYSGILGEWGDYFQMAGEDHILTTTAAEMPDVDALDCFPAEVRGRVSSITWGGYASPQGYVATDAISGAPLKFDMTCDHAAPLLIHQQAGGGFISLDLLERLTLVPALAARARATIEALPQSYVALHIRHTDYKTDLQMVLDFLLAWNVQRDMVVCTDHPDTFSFFREGLPKVRLHQVTVSPVKVSGPVHRAERFAPAEVRRDLAENSLIELCVMAGAFNLFVAALQSLDTGSGPKVLQGGPPRLSGFSRLAAHLCQDKARLRRFMGAAGAGLLPALPTGRVTVIKPQAPPAAA